MPNDKNKIKLNLATMGRHSQQSIRCKKVCRELKNGLSTKQKA
jgi:hypothetical protein